MLCKPYMVLAKDYSKCQLEAKWNRMEAAMFVLEFTPSTSKTLVTELHFMTNCVHKWQDSSHFSIEWCCWICYSATLSTLIVERSDRIKDIRFLFLWLILWFITSSMFLHSTFSLTELDCTSHFRCEWTQDKRRRNVLVSSTLIWLLVPLFGQTCP